MSPTSFNAWNLDPSAIYMEMDESVVSALMRQLGAGAAFADVPAHESTHRVIGYENHPTHWIIVTMWQNLYVCPPGHVLHRYVKSEDPNGHLFEAYPKAEVRREIIELRLMKQVGHSVRLIQLPPNEH